ncbi:MAG: hypothetical protein SGPRY_011941, partial [Prymnesium sp.]
MGDYSYYPGPPATPGAQQMQMHAASYAHPCTPLPLGYPPPHMPPPGYAPHQAYGMGGYCAHPGYMPPPSYPQHTPAILPATSTSNADAQSATHGILKPSQSTPTAAPPASALKSCSGFCSGGMQAGTIESSSGFCSGGTQAGTMGSSGETPICSSPAPQAAPPCSAITPAASSTTSKDSGLVIMSGTGAVPDKMRGMCSSNASEGAPVHSALQAALAAFEARHQSGPPQTSISTASLTPAGHQQLSASAAANEHGGSGEVFDADADANLTGGEKRAAMMQRFAERSSLDGSNKIAAPRVYKKEKAEQSLDGLEYDDDPQPPSTSHAFSVESMPGLGLPGIGMGATDPHGLAVQQQLQKAIEKELAEKQRAAQGQPPTEASSFSKAPPAHLWPLPLKRWVEKCFLLCRTSLERTAMQRQASFSYSPNSSRSLAQKLPPTRPRRDAQSDEALALRIPEGCFRTAEAPITTSLIVIERAAEADEVNTREWDKEPIENVPRCSQAMSVRVRIEIVIEIAIETGGRGKATGRGTATVIENAGRTTAGVILTIAAGTETTIVEMIKRGGDVVTGSGVSGIW